MSQIPAKICDHSFLTVKVRALWLAGQGGGDEMNVSNDFHCEGFQNFLLLISWQVITMLIMVEMCSHSNLVMGQRGYRMFMWSWKILGRKRNRVGMGILGSQHQLPAVFYPSCLRAILGSWLNPSGIYFIEKTKNRFVGRGRSSNEGSSWALRRSLPNAEEWPWIHQGLHKDAGILLHIVTYICVLFKKTMETSHLWSFLHILLYASRLFLKCIRPVIFPKKSALSPLRCSRGRDLEYLDPIPHTMCSSWDVPHPLSSPFSPYSASFSHPGKSYPTNNLFERWVQFQGNVLFPYI